MSRRFVDVAFFISLTLFIVLMTALAVMVTVYPVHQV